MLSRPVGAPCAILFLYRHSFELYLKSIVFRAAVLTINEKELGSALPKLWRKHSLVALFEMAKPVLKASDARPLTVTGELEQRIGCLACEIDSVDSGSYSFRYPVTSRGRSALNGTFFTNIFVFSERVESVLDDVAQFCSSLEDERIESSEQMKGARATDVSSTHAGEVRFISDAPLICGAYFSDFFAPRVREIAIFSSGSLCRHN